MLINNTAYKDQYTSDGNTVAFPITFPFFENSQVKVYYSPEGSEEANLVESTTYTITGAGSESGGTLTFTTAPEAGITIAILRDMPITQTYEYTELDNFPAESHENALAKLTMICQELKEETDRSIKVPATSTDPAEDYAVQMFEASAVAQQSVSAAAASATSAAASEASALASKSAAAGSATAAASSASAASASAAAAATSEANASDSETAASSSASAAASSAIASAGSASAAATSEQAAASSASAASASASAAATSESNAATSATNASTSASNAASSESAAAGSAITAQSWAESETPPDPNNTESKSAKTWALSAAANVPIASTTYAGKVMASASLNVDQTTGEATVPQITALEAFRISCIGTAMPVASTTLDDSYKIADGSLVLFADYPELEAKYEANGLMVLPSTSTAAQRVAKPLYFVVNSGGTGLYLPRLSGLFSRAWTGTDDGTAGGYNKAGLPNIAGTFGSGGKSYPFMNGGSFTGVFYNTNPEQPENDSAQNLGEPEGNEVYRIGFQASRSNSLYGNSTTVMPKSYNQPIAIYLGQCATA